MAAHGSGLILKCWQSGKQAWPKPVQRLKVHGLRLAVAEPILIWGAGAIGGILGAYWARAGVPVQMVDIVPEHANACSTSGLSIEGPVEEFTQVVPCITPEQLTGTYSRIVLAVKAQAMEGAMAQLLPHLAPDGDRKSVV